MPPTPTRGASEDGTTHSLAGASVWFYDIVVQASRLPRCGRDGRTTITANYDTTRIARRLPCRHGCITIRYRRSRVEKGGQAPRDSRFFFEVLRVARSQSPFFNG